MNRELLEVIISLKDKFSKGVKGMAAKSTASLRRVKMGFQNVGKAIKGAMFSLKGLMAAFLALAVIRGFVNFMKAASAAAMVQENAITKLNAALAATGNYSIEASANLQAYASALQETLGIGDEVTLSTLGMIEGLTKLSAEALPDAMDAVVQLTNLYGGDFNSNALMLGKTLSSNLNALARNGVQLDMTADAAGRLSQILEATAAGMVIAEAKMFTFEGQTVRLTNSWGDFMEVLGSWITESPKVVAIIKLLGGWIIELTTGTSVLNERMRELVGEGFALVVRAALGVVLGITNMLQAFNLAKIIMATFTKNLAELASGALDFYRTSITVFIKWLENIINVGVAGLNKLIIGTNTILRTNIGLLSSITLDAGELINTTIGALDNLANNMTRDIVGLAQTSMELNDLTQRIVLAQDELASAVANAGDAAGGAIVNYEQFAGALDEVAGAGGGANDVLADMNDELTETIDRLGAIEPLIAGLIERFVSFSNAWTAVGAIDLEAFWQSLRGGPDIQQLISEQMQIPGFDGLLAVENLLDRTAISGDPIEQVFSDLENVLINSAMELGEAIISGDVRSVLQQVFNNLASVISEQVSSSISASIGGGNTFGGAILGAVGGGIIGGVIGLIGGLFGGGGRPQGTTRANPVYVEEVRKGDIAEALLNVVKSLLTGNAAGGINRITSDLHLQGQRFNAS